MKVEVIPARPHHVGRMLRAMRHQHRVACTAAGVDQHRELATKLAESPHAFTYLVDGVPSAMWGVAGTIMAPSGFVWLVVADAMAPHGARIAREARRQLDAVMATRSSLTTTIPVGDVVALRFAQHLGFRPAPFASSPSMIVMILDRDRPPPLRDPSAPRPFLVFALPRSRTRWLADFLSHGGSYCRHDLSVWADTPAELRRLLSVPGVGTSETWMGHGWPLLTEWFPDARIVVVRRPMSEVVESLNECGLSIPRAELDIRLCRLNEIAALPGAMVVDFADIDAKAGAIYRHCLGREMPPEWFDEMNRDIQIDMRVRLETMTTRQDRMANLHDALIAGVIPVTIQVEPFASFWPDAIGLVTEHHREAGDMEGFPLDPNIELAESLDRAGYLLIVTARAGMRLVGYIVFTFAPSLESKAAVTAVQGPWFVSPAWRGTLGLRLHAHARRALVARGGIVGVTLRAGVRGTGPRHGRFYEALGARDMGRLYHLPLEA